MKEYKYDVSIVIVSMNNVKDLYPCLNSIKEYNHCNYEVLVTAYLYTIENLQKVRADFPWITFVESNEIRGFSENNNLSLRKAQGKYCFVLNDDTEMKMPVVDMLFNRMEQLPADTGILCPVTLNRDGSVQRCGKPKYNFGSYLLGHMGLIKQYERHSKYVNGDGCFRSYNVSGAAFFIKTDIFEKVGWFDERYFFCPEDLALSTTVNKAGYKVYVDSDIRLTHFCGGTWSKTIVATKPASVKGGMYFFAGNPILDVLYILIETIAHFGRYLYWVVLGYSKGEDHRGTMMKANLNAIAAVWSTKTPKELFTKYYLELKNGK